MTKQIVSNIKSIRLEIALLVMGAIISMSMIAMAAAFTVTTNRVLSEKGIVFRYHNETMTPEAHIDHNANNSTALETKDQQYSSGLSLIYALLIVAGSATVAIIVSNLVVRPLAELQKAIEAVGPEGINGNMAILAPSKDLGTTQLINTLSNKLNSAMESRMRLVAAAGHDLRTPITRLRLRLEFLENEEERAQWEKDINELTEIADSAIKLVKEEFDDGSSQFLPLDTILEDVCNELIEIGHDVKVSELSHCVIAGGYHSIKRALTNLVSNACKHGLRARVSLSVADGYATIRIQDDGPGIPNDQLERVFEPFYRVAGATQKKIEGAGLGLAIAKEIVQRHRGTIELANKLPHGLIQTIALPITNYPTD